MNVTETSQRLMKSMTAEEIEDALRKAQAPRGTHKSTKKGVRGKGKKKNLTQDAGIVNKNTRPLNSYMAFRSFYSPIFSSVQKKEISGFVTYMWHADPFKAKWTILAKAYSAIRDAQGKANAPLDQFLTLNTPLVGIIEPPRYLEALGWNFIVEGDGHIVVQREEPRFDADSLTTDISVNGVIQNCHMQGYITGPLSDILLANDESILTVSQASSLVRDEGVGEEVADPQTSQGGTPAPGYQSVGEQDSDTHMPEPIDNSLSTPSTYTDGLSEANVSSTPEVLQPVIFSEATQALLPAQYKLPQGEFVLDEAFDPLLYGEQTVFDPFAGNQFDAFDWMDGWNEYVNLDACS